MFPQVQSESLLNPEQKTRLYELERTVERNLSSFLEAGRALLAIRDERLYRTYGTWEQLCRRRFGITQSRGLELVRSAETVENLLRGPANPDSGDAPLPPDLSAQALRPLNGLEPALACACWRLASRLGKPTGHVVGQIVRVVKGAIGQGQSNGSDAFHNEAKRTQKAIFLASVHRLAAGESFSAQVIVFGVKDAVRARRCTSACKELIARCEAVVRQLQYRFPEL